MSRTWHAITVTIPAGQSDTVANFLMELGAPGVILEDDETGVRVTGHFDGLSPCSSIARFCDSLGIVAAVSTSEVREEDWAENWKDHFVPIAIGGRLWIAPPWDATPPPGRLGLIIEPGMAFGTGQHATTASCLELIDRATERFALNTALDLGSGSGILAIALAKLGVQRVRAVDDDSRACEIARANLRANGVERVVEVSEHWPQPPESFDLVVANLFTDLLLKFSDKISRLLAPQALLICSGFTEVDKTPISDSFFRHNLEAAGGLDREGWSALVFRKVVRQ